MTKKINLDLLNLKVNIQFGRTHNSSKDVDDFHMTIQDEASNLLIADLVLTPMQFADMLSNRSVGNVIATLYRCEEHGKTHESKTVTVPFTGSARGGEGRDEALLKKIVTAAEKENPGWKGDLPRSWNHHDVGGSKYKIILRRWV